MHNRFARILMVCVMAAQLSATAVYAAKDWWIVKRSNQRVEGDRITADDQGNLTLILDLKSNVSVTVRRGDYVQVHTPRPRELDTLKKLYEAKQYDNCIKGAQQLFGPLKYLGWGPEIAYYEGMAYLAKGDYPNAQNVFDEGIKYAINRDDRSTLNRGLIEVFLGQKQLDKAQKALEELNTKDPETAAYYWDAKGRLFALEGKQRESVLQHLKVILLLKDASPEIRRSSYESVIATLKQMGDKRYLDFEKDMQAEFK